MSLLELPNELILCVSEYLPQVDLLNVALSCKRLQNVSKPELYREYTDLARETKGRSLMPFIKVLATNAEVRKYVRIVRLRAWEDFDGLDPDDWRWLRRREQGINEEYYEFLTAHASLNGIISSTLPYEKTSSVVRRLEEWKNMTLHQPELTLSWKAYAFDHIDATDVPFDQKFCQLLQLGVEEPMVILLLSFLPNLEEVLFLGVRHLMEWLRFVSLRHPPKLRKFTAKSENFLECDITPVSSPSLMPTFSMDNYVRLPSLLGSGHRLSSSSFPPGSLNVTKVKLVECHISYPELKDFLEACCAIRSFHYAYVRNYQLDALVSSSNIIELLSNHKSTLEYLFFFPKYLDPEYQEEKGVWSLAEFTVLEELVIYSNCFKWMAQELFPGPEIPEHYQLRNRLPASLKKLIIDSFTPLIEANIHTLQVQELLLYRPVSLPNLRSFDLQSFISSSYKHLEGLDDMDEGFIFRSHGHPGITQNEDIATHLSRHVKDMHDIEWSEQRYQPYVVKNQRSVSEAAKMKEESSSPLRGVQKWLRKVLSRQRQG